MDGTEETDRAALTALCRFELGPRPGDIDRVRADPMAAVLADLAEAPLDLPPGADLEAVEVSLETLRERRRWARQAVQHVSDLRLLRAVSNPVPADGPPPAMLAAFTTLETDPAEGGMDMAPALTDPRYQGRVLEAEIGARLERYASAPVGFTERLVMFWSNHFALGIKGANLEVSVGAFERDAIRPHVRGSFADMLLAVARHPAMLLYLENHASYGPNSPLGQRRSLGLNENLARELLELHTLGVDGGYSQADVTALARIITGWTVSVDRGVGGFRFDAARHEPGEQALLGVVYPAGGAEQGEAALRALARHPATARHIARKLAVHFVADEPPPALVARLEQAFRATDGDLAAVSRALATDPDAWQAPATKLRAPQEFVIAADRVLGARRTASEFVLLTRTLGQPLWNAPAPNGFPSDTAAWLSPKGVTGRLAVSARIARSFDDAEPGALITAAFGAGVSPASRRAILSAETRSQAVAILLMTPEFQWR